MRIIVTTCDRYAHILPDFARAFARAWPDCQWPKTVLWAEDKSDGIKWAVPGWITNITPDLGWAANLLRFLGASDEPFLLLLDDYILDAADAAMLKFCAGLMDEIPSIGMIRLHPVPGPTQIWAGGHGIGRIDPAEPYAISLQAAIWRPQVCRDLFRYDEDPWQTEISGSMRARDYGPAQMGAFIGVQQSALGYRELMKRGREVPETRAWIKEHL